MSKQLHNLEIAKANGSYSKFLAKRTKVNLLIIDDRGLIPLTPVERRDFLEILDDRYNRGSTLFT
jgi:DNA replication protein DnaC